MRNIIFFISVPLLIAFFTCPADNRMIKLEKVAVSLLPRDIVVPNLGSVSIDPKGNVFAFAGKSNGNECFVVKFDQDLKYLKHFGREGKGPGDFSVRNSSCEDRLMIAANGDVYVIDYNPKRFVVFDNEGNYKKDIMFYKDYYSSFGQIYNFKLIGNDSIAGLKYIKDHPNIGVIFTLNPSRIMVNYQYSGEELSIHYPGDIQFSTRFYGHKCLIDVDSQYVVFGDSQVYKFHVYDSKGNIILEVFDKKRIVSNFSEREMKKIIYDDFTSELENSNPNDNFYEQLISNKSLFKSLVNKIKKNKNVISDIQLSGDRIFVFPVSEDITIENHYPVEIYNLKGQVLRRGYLREIPYEIWNNYVFFCKRDEEDNPLILKYKIDGSSKKIVGKSKV